MEEPKENLCVRILDFLHVLTLPGKCVTHINLQLVWGMNFPNYIIPSPNDCYASEAQTMIFISFCTPNFHTL